MQHCNFPGHELENCLGICFDQSCIKNPKYCYLCTLERHQNHSEQCVRFDVLQKKIALINNTILDQINSLNAILKQFRVQFIDFINEKLKNLFVQCQTLYSLIDKKFIEEIINKTELYQYYLKFDKEKICIIDHNIEQYFENIKTVCSQYFNQMEQNIQQVINDDFKIFQSKQQVIQNSQLLFNQENVEKEEYQNQKEEKKAKDQVNSVNIQNQDHDDQVNNVEEIMIQMMIQDEEQQIQLENIYESEKITAQELVAVQNFKNHNVALEQLEKAINLDQNNDEAYHLKGQLLQQQKLYSQSECCFKNAIKLNPKHKQAQIGLVDSLTEQNKLIEAEKVVEQAIIKIPNNQQLYQKKGHVLFFQKRYNESIEACDQAIQLDPQFSSAFNTKGCSLLKMSNYDEALKTFNLALQLDPTDQTIIINLLRMLLDAEKFEEAAKYLNEAEQKGIIDDRLLEIKCQILFSQCKYKEALQICDQGLIVFPEDLKLKNIKQQLIDFTQNYKNLQDKSFTQ